MLEDMQIPVPLYHGTSTLFLEGILKLGLGGMDAIAEWKVLEFARAIAPLVDEHCAGRDDLALKAYGFGCMIEQLSGASNFQHGHSYLSPALSTAVRYAASNRYGSELLTNTLGFLQELLNLDVPGVRDALYRQFPEMFRMLDVSPAPLLIRIDNVPITAVLNEHGNQPDSNVELIRENAGDTVLSEALFQQLNFRLMAPQKITEVCLINVTRFDLHSPDYTLYPLHIPHG
jgi:hypothetical protein